MVIFSFLGFYSCLILISLGANTIFSSAFIALICSFFPKIIDTKANALIYCATFAAIGVTEVTDDYLLLPIIPFIVWIINKKLQSYFVGHGGKLGTIAFISVGAIFLLVKFI